ncbi:MAG: protoporphyrinogen oxidase [Actinopolymorphaceae bacterium]
MRQIVRHVVVVGGGVTGVAAAWFLRQVGGPDLAVTVLESSPRLGGKLHTVELAGVRVDTGAEAILNRRPEGVDLVRAVGLGERLRYAATTAASLWSRAALRPIPAGTVLGVPGDLAALRASGLLSAEGMARVEAEPDLPGAPLTDDVAIGAYAAERMGQEAVDRLVEPLLGGVYAGRSDQLSLQATVPALVPHLREDPSLLRAAAGAKAATPASDSPVFAGLAGGVGGLVPAVAGASGASIRTDATVRELRPTPGGGWRLVVGPTRAPELVDADAVLLACPARPASRLLADVAPVAAGELAGIEYASMATIALAFPSSAVPHTLPGSGFLVPPVEGRLIKAATFSSAKWSWMAEDAPDVVIIRCSVGRLGDVTELQRDDAALVAGAAADLRELVGVGRQPIDAHVARWGGGLPQYAVGHRARVARIRVAVGEHPGLAVAGAAYEGVGIPACVASARSAVTQLLGAADAAGTMTA